MAILAGGLLIGLGLAAAILLIRSAAQLRVLPQTVFALVSRLALGTFMLWRWGPSSDGVVYNDQAVALAKYLLGTSDAAPELNPGKEALPVTLGLIYASVGYFPFVAVVISALITASLPILMARIASVGGIPAAGGSAAWLIVLFPSTVFFTSMPLLRESLILALLALGVLGFLNIRQGAIARGALQVFLAALIMIPSRGGLTYLLMIVMPVILVTEAAMSRNRAKALPVAAGVLFAGVLVSAAAHVHLTQAQYFDSARNAVVEEALNVGATSFDAAGGVSAGPSAGPEAPLGPFGERLESFVAVLAGPFPWQWNNLPLVVVGIDALIWITLWGLTLAGFLNGTAKWPFAYMVVPALALAAYLSLTATNFGLILRMRGLLLAFIAVPAAHGVRSLFRRWREGPTEQTSAIGQAFGSG